MYEIAIVDGGTVFVADAAMQRVFQLVGDCLFLFGALMAVNVLILGAVLWLAFRAR